MLEIGKSCPCPADLPSVSRHFAFKVLFRNADLDLFSFAKLVLVFAFVILAFGRFRPSIESVSKP